MSILGNVSTIKEYDFNGVKIKIGSIELDEDTAKLMQSGENSSLFDNIEGIKRLVKKTIGEYIPDATEEEINQSMKLKNLMRWTEIIFDVNGLTDSESQTNVDKIKQRIAQINESRKSG